MIDLQHVTLSYGETPVLTDCSLTVPGGGSAALMGPSGCGKTTLLRVAAGLAVPASGTVRIQGRVSCVFQEPRLFPWLTAEENLRLVLSGPGKDPGEAKHWLRRLGLEAAGDKYPAELSGGMQQRIAIGRALAYGGDVLLMDEPFRGLDQALRLEMMALVRESAKGRTLLFATHREDEAEALAGAVYVYRDGRFSPAGAG